MDLVRESTLVLPFRFLRQPGPPLADIVLGPPHVSWSPPELRELRLRAPHTNDPVLDDYLIVAPAESAALTVDHLALAITWAVPRFPDFSAPDDLALALEDAARSLTREVLGRFLFYLKFRTKTIWLAHAGAPVGGRVLWREDPGEQTHTARPSSSPLAPGRGLTYEIWSQLERDLRSGTEPEPHQLSLFQARELLAVGMRAMAVLSAAIACETKARRVTEELQGRKPGGLEDPAYAKLTNRHAKVPASQVLSSVMDLVCGRSLIREDRMLFETMERLFNIRNTVAHTGRCALREGASIRDVDLAEVKTLVEAVDLVHDWLDRVYEEAAASVA